MAKKKQSLPKRSNGLLRQAADVVGATGDVILDEADINRTTTHKKNSSTRSSGDVIFYSPAKVGDFAIYFAEVGLQAAVYHNSMQATIVNGVFDRGTLSVRLYLSVLDKNSMVGVHPISVEDVRLELYWNEDDSNRDLTIEEEEESELNIFLSGYLDCRDEEVSAFIYLFKSGYISVNPQLRIDEKGPAANGEVVCRLAVGISQKSFDGAGELLNSGKTLWSRNMMKLMKWLRPDLHCDEVIYGVHGNMPINECSTMPFKGDGHDSNNRNQQTFNPLLLYEALRPDRNLPPLDTVPQKLLANLRTYQSQAAQWMVMRELAVISSAQDNSQLTSRDNWPFCLQVSSLDEKNVFYYNPFSGVVSRMPVKNFSDVRGGILADEMGLGKTVELLACIMSNCDKMSTSQGDEAAKKATEELNMKLKRRKRERIACPCGEDTDDDNGIWVQCDVCDVWHHAACVGFGMEFVSKERYELEMAMRKRQSNSPQQHKGKRRKIRPDAVFVREERYTVDKDYVCGTCARIIGSVEVGGVCGATLIVCPSSIIGQWQEEIARHTEKGALKVIIYEGFHRGPPALSSDALCGSKYGEIVGAHELAKADIVLTTYNTLQADLLHDTDGDQTEPRSMRYVKRYPVVPTPLTRLTWKRVCLDEAQMVENTSARATEMAKRLRSEIRWCITGTPIQRSLDDLYGLLSFLDLQPFCDYFWWTKVLKEPYERNAPGAMDFVHNYLKKFMWRSSKAHVSHELGLPPQEESLTWLIFSPVEAHFYRRQHERCAKKALEVMTENMGGMVDRKLTPNEVAKIMHPLLSLRQACCHPQVGSSGLRSLQKLPMTMDEVLKVLIDKAKIEGEEAQRNLIGSLNGLAALNILEGDLPAAVNLYREALFIVEENREIFDVDPLQKLHVLHNLQEVLCTQREPNNITDGDFLSRVQPMIGMDEPSSQKINALSSNDSVDSGGISKDNTSLSAWKNPSCKLDLCRTLRDSFLGQQCEEICTKYMASFYAKLSAAKQDYEDVHSEVLAHLKSLEDMNGATWWLDVLAIVSKESRKEKEMVNKIKSSLEDKEAYGLSNQVHINASSLASRFKDVNGLKYVLTRELDAIFECRNKFLVKISEFDEMIRSPTAENIQRAGNCSKCAQRGGPSCAICEADVIYKMYEKRLFKLRSNASSPDEVSLENALTAQQRLLSQKHMNTLKNGVGTGGSSSQESSQQRTKDEGTDIAKIEVSRTPSETETILKLMKSFMKQNMDAGLLAASSKHLELLEAMRKEYSQARLLAVSQSMVLLALDELNMAKTRLCLRFPGEGEDSHTRSDPFKVHSEEIPQRNAQLTGEKFTSLDDLRRAKGQVRYLQGLATIRERSKIIHKTISTQLNNGEALPRENTESLSTTGAGGGFMEEICPVCQDHLGKQMMVFPCGHLLCCKCLMPVADIETPSEMERKRIACPSCRHRTSMENIAFIDNGLGERSYSLSHNNKENCRSDEESFVSVNGSYGTKMEAVVRRILRVQAADPSSRFLVFSTWNDVLDVVGHSLSANNVGFLRAKGGRHLSTIIRKFKARDEAAKVLLLLIQQCSNGLNLTEAQHVILVEPLLNPGAEAQAVNRIHRIGQEKATYVHKFLIKDTVEESIHKLSQLKSQSQSQKFSAAGKMGNQEVAALTLKDLRVLFEDEAACSSNHIPPIQSHVMNDNEPTSRSLNLRDLPPSVAAAAAAEARLQHAQNARVPNEQ